MKKLREWARLRRDYRLACGAFDFGIPRPRITFAAAGAATGTGATNKRHMANVHVGEREEVDVRVEMEGKASSAARSLVEECMLLAGEAAARYAHERHIPFLYRAQIAGVRVPTALGLQAPATSPPTPGLSGDETVELCRHFQQLLLMKPAVTMPFMAPHAGLGLKAYSQVTSPIRRYADLVLHRQLKASLLRPAAGRADAGGWVYSKQDLLELVPKLEQQTAAITRLQRSCERFWVLEFIRRGGLHVVYDGLVVRVHTHRRRGDARSSVAASVLLSALGHIERVHGLAVGQAPVLGARVRVRVQACDPLTGLLSLRFVDE